jgi:hypothetical protein
MEDRASGHPVTASAVENGRRAAFRWRRTWPIGAADDFVADLPGGWARMRLVRATTGRGHWQWCLGGRSRARGAAESRDDAERALMRSL